MIRGLELTHLECPESPADSRPRFLALELSHPFDEKGKDAELDMSFDAARQPVIHGLHLDPASLRVPPLIFRLCAYSRMAFSLRLLCKGVSGCSNTSRSSDLLP